MYHFAEVGDSLNGTVGHVKDAMVGAVHGIGQGLDGVMHTAADGVKSIGSTLSSGVGGLTESGTEYTHIPLKVPEDGANLDEFKEKLLMKVESIDADEMAGGAAAADVDALDALLAESESVAADGSGGDNGDDGTKTPTPNDAKHTANNAPQPPQQPDDDSAGIIANVANADPNKTPTHSIDSLRTSSPDPEIEMALSNVDAATRRNGPSPVPTINELSELDKAANAAAAATLAAAVAGGDNADQHQ